MHAQTNWRFSGMILPVCRFLFLLDYCLDASRNQWPKLNVNHSAKWSLKLPSKKLIFGWEVARPQSSGSTRKSG